MVDHDSVSRILSVVQHLMAVSACFLTLSILLEYTYQCADKEHFVGHASVSKVWQLSPHLMAVPEWYNMMMTIWLVMPQLARFGRCLHTLWLCLSDTR